MKENFSLKWEKILPKNETDGNTVHSLTLEISGCLFRRRTNTPIKHEIFNQPNQEQIVFFGNKINDKSDRIEYNKCNNRIRIKSIEKQWPKWFAKKFLQFASNYNHNCDFVYFHLFVVVPVFYNLLLFSWVFDNNQDKT